MKISVSLCTFNGSKYIIEQLESILKQTRLPDEIVMVDDISEDDTVALAENYLKRSNIEYHILRNTERLGVAANFLKAMKYASGDYIFCCDQDDIWMENKIACFLKQIHATKKMLYFSNGMLVNAEGVPMNCTLWESVHFDPIKLNKNTPFDLILQKCFVTGAAMAVSKELVEMIDEIPAGWLHDGWLSLMAGLHQSIEAIDEITFYYRQHGNNVIGTHGKSLSDTMKVWKSNTNKLPKVRRERYLRFLSIKERKIIENNQKLDACIRFWNDLDQLKQHSHMRQCIIIIKHLLTGNYRKFYTGISGAFRDIISIGLK